MPSVPKGLWRTVQQQARIDAAREHYKERRTERAERNKKLRELGFDPSRIDPTLYVEGHSANGYPYWYRRPASETLELRQEAVRLWGGR